MVSMRVRVRVRVMVIIRVRIKQGSIRTRVQHGVYAELYQG